MGSLLERVETPEFSDDFHDEFTDDFPQEFESDPPSEAFAPTPAGRKISDKLKPSTRPVPAATKKRVAAEVQLYLELVIGVGEMTCEPCAEVAMEHVKKISERAAILMCRYPDMVEKFIQSGAIAEGIALLAAVRPVAKQLVGHHITHSIQYEGETDGAAVDYSGYGPYRP